MLNESILRTLELIKQGKVNLNNLRKATFSQPANATSGLQLYDLEAPAKQLIPIILPLLSSTTRSGGGKSIQANWQVVTGQNTGKATAGVPEGKRNSTLAFAQARYNAVYKTLSMEGSATLQATLAAQGFDDVRGRSRSMSVNSLFVEQERIMFGGNTTSTGIALGTGPTPVVTTASTSGGAITTAAAFVRVVPLSVEGMNQASVSATGIPTGGVRTVQPADGSATYTVNLGNGAIGAEGTVGSMTGSTNQVKATWANVKGAAGYALYYGATTGAANQTIMAITTNTFYTFTTDKNAGNQAANAANLNTDNSQDQYVYDGMYTQTIASNTAGTGGYFLSLNPTGTAAGTLTADGKGGINEFDAFLIDRYNLYKFTDFEIHVGGNQMNNISKKIRAGSASTPFMVQVTDGKADITGGGRAVAYTHPLTGKALPLVLNPNVPDGTIFFKGTSLPAWFANTNITTIWEVGERLSYTSMDWPLLSWEYKTAAIVDEVLKGYVPFGNGVLSEVAIG
jgi:hypothetical protein